MILQTTKVLKRVSPSRRRAGVWRKSRLSDHLLMCHTFSPSRPLSFPRRTDNGCPVLSGVRDIREGRGGGEAMLPLSLGPLLCCQTRNKQPLLLGSAAALLLIDRPCLWTRHLIVSSHNYVRSVPLRRNCHHRESTDGLCVRGICLLIY